MTRLGDLAHRPRGEKQHRETKSRRVQTSEADHYSNLLFAVVIFLCILV